MSDWLVPLPAFLRSTSFPLIAILGPTASGKTAFSLAVADACKAQGKPAEIVNCDSRQLFKGLDVGTAKITEEEMRGVPHHLFSVLDPKEEATIAWYQEQATPLVEAIQARGHVPILVGGSMLYASSVIDGLQPLPSVDPELRAEISHEYDRDQGKFLYATLKEVDPETAEAFSPKNKRYLVRAMELYRSTGMPPSALKKQVTSAYDILLYGLKWPRDVIIERINARTPILLKSGWIEEVEGLIKEGYTEEDPGMQSHGYREVMQWIKNGKKQEDYPALVEKVSSVTRKYAKRQMTWWKRDDRIHWVDGASVI